MTGFPSRGFVTAFLRRLARTFSSKLYIQGVFLTFYSKLYRSSNFLILSTVRCSLPHPTRWCIPHFFIKTLQLVRSKGRFDGAVPWWSIPSNPTRLLHLSEMFFFYNYGGVAVPRTPLCQCQDFESSGYSCLSLISTVRCSIPPPTRRSNPSIPIPSNPLIGLGDLNHSMVI